MVDIPDRIRDAVEKFGRKADFEACCGRLEREGVLKSRIAYEAAYETVPEIRGDIDEKRKVKRARARKEYAKARSAKVNGYRMLEWVVENLDEPKADRDDAPNAAAWSVLKAAMDDDDVKRDVLKKYLDSKLKLDAAKGDTDTRKIDGQEEYDILEGIGAEVFA